MSNEPTNNNQNDSKTKFSLKEALFGGGGGVAGTGYQIIYFSMFAANGMSGPEPTFYIIYGDGRSIFTSTFLAASVLFSYNNDAKTPTVKLNKRFLPGGSKAEIILPPGYSFMGMPVHQQQESQGQQTSSSFDPNVKYQDPYAGITKLEDQIAPDIDKIDQILQAQYENEETSEENDSESKFIPPESAPKIVDTSDVIQEEEFVATFDGDALTERMNKFMDKHNIDPPKVQVRAKKDESDPRTIEEVKKETVDEEVDRIIKNAENIRDTTFEETDLSIEIKEVRPSVKDKAKTTNQKADQQSKASKSNTQNNEKPTSK